MSVKRAAEFEVRYQDGSARVGRLFTSHGEIDTPVFMPVGTQGTVKGLSPDRIRATGANLILGNTYHLYLRPGSERIERLGGLHAFSNWAGAILTDSGGFQVFSLAKLRRINDHGVRFQSHLDGSRHEFTPEHSMDVQAQLGADIVMAFDECPALPASPAEVATAVNRTIAWADRCREHFGDRRCHPAGHEQALFGIVQGGLDVEERARCASALKMMDFAGYAIGGLSVGEEKIDMHRMAAATAPLLPDDKPRYLMGVGYPEDILAAVAAGVDMFDCVLPTRLARHGTVLTPDGRMSLRNARFAEDPGPIEEGCPCQACSGFSRAYLRHLIMAREMLGFQLTTEHNLTFYQRLMQAIRDAVAKQRFGTYRTAFLARYLQDRS